MPAAFQVGRGDSSVDACAEWCRVSDVTVAEQVYSWVTVVALSAGIWAVAVFTTGVPGAVFLTAAATVQRATGASAASAILKGSRLKKVVDWH
jgi:hypothetical protein